MTAIAERQNVREQSARVLELVKKGVYAEARADREKAALESAEAAVSRAEAELEQARQSLGAEGADECPDPRCDRRPLGVRSST